MPVCRKISRNRGLTVVGYNTINTGAAKRHATLTPSFLPVNGAATYKMKDLTVTGLAYDIVDPDTLQTLNSASSSSTAMYFYLDKAGADALCKQMGYPEGSFDVYIGWWDQARGGLGVGSANEDVIANGTGFYGNIRSGNDVAVQASGEAPTKSTSYTTDGKRHPLFGCYIPKTLKLKQLTASGLKYDIVDPDVIQFLNPVTSSSTTMYFYLDKASADALCKQMGYPEGSFDAYIGWWDQARGGLGVGDASEDEVAVGATFFGNIRSLSEVTINYPSSLD